MKSVYGVSERFTTDDGIECEVVEVHSPSSITVQRLDTGEITPATISNRHPPKGWQQVTANTIKKDQ